MLCLAARVYGVAMFKLGSAATVNIRINMEISSMFELYDITETVTRNVSVKSLL